MKDRIKSKLDRIDELFPKERVQKSKGRITAVWDGHLPDDRLPYTCNPLYLNIYNDYNGVDEIEQSLCTQLDECILHGRMNDDFIPSLFPGCKTATIPNMFGAKEVFVGNNWSSEKIIHRIEDIDNLGEPDMGSGTIAYEWLQRQKYFLEETEGRIPIHVADMQGPMDVSGVMWGYDEFFLSLYSNPEAVRRLLNKSAEAFIKFWRLQEELLGEHFIGTHLFGFSWVPRNNGATLSADSMVMVSGDFFDEFYIPVLEKISKELGGITIHSCGKYSHLMNNIQHIPGLKGINASQMSLAELQDAGLRNNIMLIYMSKYDDVFEDIERIKRTFQPADITILDIRPDSIRKDAEKPNKWSRQDWDVFYEREKKLIEALTL